MLEMIPKRKELTVRKMKKNVILQKQKSYLK